jgi:hypothetical protein
MLMVRKKSISTETEANAGTGGIVAVATGVPEKWK